MTEEEMVYQQTLTHSWTYDATGKGMTEEEMVYQSVRAVAELDQDVEAEARYLRDVQATLTAFLQRYPTPHLLRESISWVMIGVEHALAAYGPYLPPAHVFTHEEEAPTDAPSP